MLDMIWTRLRNDRKSPAPERSQGGLFQVQKRNDFLGGCGAGLGC